MAELADALDLGSSGATRESSSLSFRTITAVTQNGELMQVLIEDTSNLEKEISFTIPADSVKQQFDVKVKDLCLTAKIDGFSPGRKIPSKIIERKFGKQIRAEVLDNTVQGAIKDAFAEHNINPANQPVIKDLQDGEENLTFKLLLEVLPTIEVKDYKEIKLVKKVATISDADKAKMLDKIRLNLAKWEEANKKAEANDMVVIDYKSTIDGESYENSDAFDKEIIIGSSNFYPEIEDKLIGMQIEDEFKVNVVLPESMQAASLAGKTAEFEVKVVRVKQRKPVTVDAEFAKNIGIEDGDIEKVDAKIEEIIQNQIKHRNADLQKQELFEELAKQYDFAVPTSLVNKEKQEIFANNVNTKTKALDENDASLIKDATDRVRVGLVLTEIVKKEGIKASEEQLQRQLQEFAAMFGNMEYVAKMYQNSPELRANINHRVLMDQVVDLLIEKATIEEQTVSVDDILS